MRTIGLVAALCVLSVAVGSGEAGKKKKVKVPKGYVETLLGPGEWVLANEEGDELTLRSYNQRKVGKAKVANLDWKVQWKRAEDHDQEWSGNPNLIAVTKKGIHLMYVDPSLDDAALAKQLAKRKPDFKLPLKAGKTKLDGDFDRVLEVDGGKVCVGYSARGMCGGDGCDARMCMNDMGLVSVSAGYSPDELGWGWIAGGLTVAETAPADPGEQAIVEVKALRDRACACKTKKCGETVMADLDVWTANNASTTATSAQLEILTQLGTELGTCVANLR